MKRVLLALAAVAVLAGSSDAGPIRNAIQRIRGGGCGSCRPAAQAYPQVGPVRQAVGGVLTTAGQAVQTPLVYQTCPGGLCR